MIITILFLSLFFIVISLIIYFLIVVMVPAVKEQTGVHSNIIFSHLEHNYAKLKKENPIEKSGKKAIVKCFCNKKFDVESNAGKTGQSCSVINHVYETLNDCKYSCLGLGDCIKVCDRNAIVIKDNCAVITELCNGCGKCADVCPKKLISIINVDEVKSVFCKNDSISLSSCSKFKKEEKVQWPERKYFKIWKICYKLFGGK